MIYDILGWYGTVAVVGAFAALSFGWIKQGLIYQCLNFTGAIGIIAVTWVNGVYQPAVLNMIWGMIALYAIVQLYRQKRIGVENKELLSEPPVAIRVPVPAGDFSEVPDTQTANFRIAAFGVVSVAGWMLVMPIAKAFGGVEAEEIALACFNAHALAVFGFFFLIQLVCSQMQRVGVVCFINAFENLIFGISSFLISTVVRTEKMRSSRSYFFTKVREQWYSGCTYLGVGG